MVNSLFWSMHEHPHQSRRLGVKGLGDFARLHRRRINDLALRKSREFPGSERHLRIPTRCRGFVFLRRLTLSLRHVAPLSCEARFWLPGGIGYDVISM
jgi:hypothetical protein